MMPQLPAMHRWTAAHDPATMSLPLLLPAMMATQLPEQAQMLTTTPTQDHDSTPWK